MARNSFALHKVSEIKSIAPNTRQAAEVPFELWVASSTPARLSRNRIWNKELESIERRERNGLERPSATVRARPIVLFPENFFVRRPVFGS
jgi:hypothetical protein